MSKWVGIVGRRLETSVYVEKQFDFKSRFKAGAVSYIYLMKDKDGNELTLSTSKEFRIGEVYNIRATVKEHVLREGVEQTRITNVYIME